MADRPRIAIVTALKEELEGILVHAKGLRRRDEGIFEARFGSAAVVLAATGDGMGKARHKMGKLCDALGPAAVIGAGVAGALSRGLQIGDLVAGLRVRDSAGEAPAPDERLLAWALASGASAGILLTVENPVVSASKKAALAASLPGDTFAAVDMESAAWARAAASRGIPYLVVRSISDRADEELPPYLARCVDGDGRIRRAAVAGYSLARPGTIPALMRMRKRTHQCAEHLGLFLERLLGAEAVRR